MFCYFHIPFCRQKCSYCKFALTPFVKDVQIRQYLAYLANEAKIFCAELGSDVSIDSLYFGGGTPSVLTPEQIGSIVEIFSSRLGKNCEFTLEANPEDITKEWVNGVLKLGVNRISLGVQSLGDATLSKIGRGSSEGIFSALEILEASAVYSVNIDWILGLPYAKSGDTFQDMQDIFESFSCVKHTSIYFLEKGEYPKDWEDICMGDDDQRAEYFQMRAFLIQKGWHHYEVSNFSKPGFECRHNMSYWNHSFVRGFGLSAASYIPSTSVSDIHGFRFENSATFSGYYRGDRLHQENISNDSYLLEKGMFGLRTFSLSISEVLPSLSDENKMKKIHQFIEEGLIENVDGENSGRIRPTVDGIFIIDYLLEELL